MKALKWFAALFFLTGLFGCAHVQEYVDMARSDSLSTAYVDALNTYTQEKTVYSEFETRIRVVATWKSREFTDAYLSEHARLYDLTTSAREEKRDIVSAASSDFREFLFYAYVPDRESNDFAKARSIWKVFSFHEGGQRMEPLEIREIETTPLVTKFFPYVKPYGKFYSVKFPPGSPLKRKDAADQTGPTLVVTGILGKAELKWNVKNP